MGDEIELEADRSSVGPQPTETHAADGPQGNESSPSRRSVVVTPQSTLQRLSTFAGTGGAAGWAGTGAMSPIERQRRGSSLSRPPSIAPSLLGGARQGCSQAAQAVSTRARAFQDGPGGVNYFDVLVSNLNRMSCLPSGFLEAKLRYKRRETERGNIVRMFCCSRPLCVALNSTRFRCMLLLYCGAALATAWMEFHSMSLTGTPLYAHYRFTGLEARDRDSGVPLIANFGLVQRELHASSSPFLSAKNSADWCSAPVMQRAVSSVNGSSMVLTLSDDDVGSGDVFVGWYFRTAWNGSVSDDPTRFMLEGSWDKATWEQIGSSSSESLAGISIFQDGYFDTPHDRGWPVVFDSRPAWYDYFEPSGRCILGLGLWAVAVLAFFDRAVDGLRVLVLCCYCLSVNSFVAAVLASVTGGGGGSAAAFFAVKCGLHFGVGFLLEHYERFFHVVLFVGALIYMIMLVYVHMAMCTVRHACRLNASNQADPKLLESMIMCLASFFIVVWRQVMVSRFRTPILADRQRYNAAWETIKKNEANQTELARLDNLVADITKVTSCRLARQYNRACTVGDDEKGGASSEEEADECEATMPPPPQAAVEGPLRRIPTQHSEWPSWARDSFDALDDPSLRTPSGSPSSCLSPKLSPKKSIPSRSPELKKSPAIRRLSSHRLMTGGGMPLLTLTPSETGERGSRKSSNRGALSSFTTTLIQAGADLYEQERTHRSSFSSTIAHIVRSPKSRMSKDMDEIVPLSESANDSFNMDVVFGTNRRRRRSTDQGSSKGSSPGSLSRDAGSAIGVDTSDLVYLPSHRRPHATDSGRKNAASMSSTPQRSWVYQIFRGDSNQTNFSDVSLSVDASDHGADIGQVPSPAAMSTRVHNKLLKGWRSTRFFNASAGSGIEQMVGERMVYTIDISSPITSLDQLHAQACILNPLLLSRTITLAELFNGKLPALEFEGARQKFVACHSSMSLRGVQVGTVKKVGRCVNKIQRSYQGDVSKLLDCCRQSIYFASLADLFDCLTALWLDNGVEIVRIKNTMSSVDDQNEASFSGFRYIAVNFRFRDDVTAELGVESHVVELLLILTQIAELRTHEAHERYLNFRDSRYASSFPALPSFLVPLKNALMSITALAPRVGMPSRTITSHSLPSQHSPDTSSSNKSRRGPPSLQVCQAEAQQGMPSMQAGTQDPALEFSHFQDGQARCDQAPEMCALQSHEDQVAYRFGTMPTPLSCTHDDDEAAASEAESSRETSSPPFCEGRSLGFKKLPSLQQERVTREDLHAYDDTTPEQRTGRILAQSMPRAPGSSRSPARLSRCDSEASIGSDTEASRFPRRNRSPRSPTSRTHGCKPLPQNSGLVGLHEAGSPQTSPNLRLDATDHPSPPKNRARSWKGNMLPSKGSMLPPLPASPEPAESHKKSAPQRVTPLGLVEDVGEPSGMALASPRLCAVSSDPPNSPPFLRPFASTPHSPILAFARDPPDSPPALRPFSPSEHAVQHQGLLAERNAGSAMGRSGLTSARAGTAQQEQEENYSPLPGSVPQAGGMPPPLRWAEGNWRGLESRSSSWRDRMGPLARTSLATTSRSGGGRGHLARISDRTTRLPIRSHSPFRTEQGSALDKMPVLPPEVAAGALAIHGIARRSSLPNMHDKTESKTPRRDRMGITLRRQIESSFSRQGTWPSANPPGHAASSHACTSEAGTSCSGSYAPTRLHTPSPTNRAAKPEDCCGSFSPSGFHTRESARRSLDDGVGDDSLMTSWLKSLATAGGIRQPDLNLPEVGWSPIPRSEWDGSMSPAARTGRSSPLTPRTSFSFKSPLSAVNRALSPMELKDLGLGLPASGTPPVENATRYFTPRRFSPPRLFGAWGPRDESEFGRYSGAGDSSGGSPLTGRDNSLRRSRSVDEGRRTRSMESVCQVGSRQGDGAVLLNSLVSVASDDTCRPDADVHCITSKGLRLTEDMVEILEMYSRIATLGLASLLDRNCKHAYKLGLETASTKSVFFTSRPVLAGSMKGWVQVGAIALASLHLSCVANGVQRNLEIGIRPVPNYLHYKMVSLTRRDGSNATEPGVQDFGLLELHGRSPLGDLGLAASHLPVPQRRTEGPAIIVSYPESVPMRGWYIVTDNNASASADPVFFEVYGSNSSSQQPAASRAYNSEDAPFGYDHGPKLREAPTQSMEWVKIGTPVWISAPQYDDITHFTHIPSWSVPQTRGTLLLFDPTHPWQYVISEVLCRMCIATGMLSFSLLGWMKAASVARVVLGVSFLVTVLFKVTCFASHVFWGNWLPAFGYFADLPGLLAVCWGIWSEKHFVKMLGVAGLLDAFLFGAQVLFIYPRECVETVTALEILRINGPILMVLFGLIHILRLSALRDSRKLVKADKERYDALWRELVEQDKDVGAIEKVERVLRMTGVRKGDAKNCHQYNRLNSDQFRTLDDSICSRLSSMNFLSDVLGDASMIPKTIDLKSPVMSVDQLYAQALVANLVLADKVRSWAAVSNGYFQLKQKRAEKEEGRVPIFVRWSVVKDDPAVVAQVKWTPLKRYKRMIEKLLRSYDADISRICDISRHAILFETLEDLSACIEQITADDEIRIERFKNRMSPSYKSEESAGYRDVALNVRVHDHPATVALGGETHCCEVQLILLKFAELKDREGHKRYVEFRNTRGQ